MRKVPRPALSLISGYYYSTMFSSHQLICALNFCSLGVYNCYHSRPYLGQGRSRKCGISENLQVRSGEPLGLLEPDGSLYPRGLQECIIVRM